MELEWLAERSAESEAYEFAIVAGTAAGAPMEVDWRPMLRAMLAELARHSRSETLARKFHNTLAEMIAGVVSRVIRLRRRRPDEHPVVLSGGCFQNRLLTELAVERPEAAGERG